MHRLLELADAVVLRVEGQRAVLSRSPDFLELAGSVPVPVDKRGAQWEEVLARTRRVRGEARR